MGTALRVALGMVVHQVVLVVSGIHEPGDGELFIVVQAMRRLGPGFYPVHRGQEGCRQDADDGHDHEQFDQGKAGNGAGPNPDTTDGFYQHSFSFLNLRLHDATEPGTSPRPVNVRFQGFLLPIACQVKPKTKTQKPRDNADNADDA